MSLWDPATGGFRFAAHQRATLLATCYAVLGLEFIGGLAELSEARESGIISFIMSGARAGGSFQDPVFHPRDVVSEEYDVAYFQEETTTFCQQALDALLAPAPPARQWPTDWHTSAGLERYLNSISWENPCLDSNRVMFVLSQLCHDVERHQKPELLDVVDSALDWLDRHQGKSLVGLQIEAASASLGLAKRDYEMNKIPDARNAIEEYSELLVELHHKASEEYSRSLAELRSTN